MDIRNGVRKLEEAIEVNNRINWKKDGDEMRKNVFKDLK